MNAQTQHTPGPMIVLLSSQACALHLAESSAKVSGKTRVLLMDRDDQNIRFLRQLAAAPELFEALHSIEKLAACGLHPDPDHAAADLSAIAATASAALAKARGEA